MKAEGEAIEWRRWAGVSLCTIVRMCVYVSVYTLHYCGTIKKFRLPITMRPPFEA